MSYRVVAHLQQEAVSVSDACRVLQVSRSGFDKLAIEPLTGFNADRVVSPVASGAVHALIGKHRR